MSNEYRTYTCKRVIESIELAHDTQIDAVLGIGDSLLRKARVCWKKDMRGSSIDFIHVLNYYPFIVDAMRERWDGDVSVNEKG